MSTVTVRPARRTAGAASGALYAARALLGVSGAVKLAGAVYFSFIATAQQGGDPHGAEWLIVAWSLALAGAFLVASASLRADGKLVRLLGGVLVVDLVFSTVKLLAYGESAALLFMTVDVLIGGLLAVGADVGAAPRGEIR